MDQRKRIESGIARDINYFRSIFFDRGNCSERKRERERKVMVEKNRSTRRRISSASFEWNICSKLWSQRQLVHQREFLALGKFFEWGKLANDRLARIEGTIVYARGQLFYLNFTSTESESGLRSFSFLFFFFVNN